MQEDYNDNNILLPITYFGIFKMESKTETKHLSNNDGVINIEECKLITAYNYAFKTQDEAFQHLDNLPRPALYTILPIYLCL